MREIKLYGHLAEKFGKVFHLEVANAAEAVRALCANFHEFQKELIGTEEAPRFYRVIVGKSALNDERHVLYPCGRSETIRIVPTLVGAGKGGVGSIIAGIALIAISFFLPVTPLIAGMSMSLSSIAMSMGISMLISGIASALSPQPKNNAADKEPAQNKPSYSFDGPVNTTLQGNCVPVGYGRLIVGSAVISAGIEVTPY